MPLLSSLCLLLASVFFGLVGFGVTSGRPHFVLMPLGLMLVAAALLLDRLPRSTVRVLPPQT